MLTWLHATPQKFHRKYFSKYFATNILYCISSAKRSSLCTLQHHLLYSKPYTQFSWLTNKNMHQKDQLPSNIFLSHITVVQSLLLKLGYCLLSYSLCCWPVGCTILLLIQLYITYELFFNGWRHYKPHLHHCQVIKWVWQPQFRCCQQNIKLYAHSIIYFYG